VLGEQQVETGEQARLPLKFVLPTDLKAGEYEISLNVKYGGGEVQEDKFLIHVMPAPVKPELGQPIALFDPAGMTKKVIEGLGTTFSEVKADAKPAAGGVLIVGKNALTRIDLRFGLVDFHGEAAPRRVRPRAGRRLQPAVRAVAGIPRRQRHGSLLPGGREQPRGARSGRTDARAQHAGICRQVAAEGGALSNDELLIVGPGVGRGLAAYAAAIGAFLKQGGHLLALGATQEEANSFLPFKVAMKTAEHMAAYFPAQDENSLFAGINPAGVLSREPRQLPLLVADADVEVLGDGVLARAKNANVVFCQMVPWTYDLKDMHNLKTSYRHSTDLVNRLLGNMGVRGTTTLLARFASPAAKNAVPKELYVDTPVEADDPYRAFGW
jgi:hypothetical protein